ncbi:MAG: fumarylacetoacetate hydrolase family protein [Silicimonas sp.]|nr:fumarylacetoacetate hydrolase family protein [Silicimonas sp.]
MAERRVSVEGLDPEGLWLGRAELPGVGPAVITLRDGVAVDITAKSAPTVRDLLDREDAADYVRTAPAAPLPETATWLAPCDLQPVKACGVTFAGSMVERVIEEQAAGDPDKAEGIRVRVGARIGDSLSNVVPGSDEAMSVKAALIEEGLWSQYLEVGIGKDAEVFSKAQALSSVGQGADIGLHPGSVWNNPEPEIVLAVNSRGDIPGATLGNDVNLRDFEGRSALLLSKAKDNNASCAIGPMIRLFDASFTLDHVRQAQLSMTVTGEDGYVLQGHSSMAEISRDPEDLVAQTIGRHHQYPDGFMLFLGTLFAPTEDRDEPGQGFTHKLGDRVEISSPGLGVLQNRVQLSTECPPWTFGTAALMRNLAVRGLL